MTISHFSELTAIVVILTLSLSAGCSPSSDGSDSSSTEPDTDGVVDRTHGSIERLHSHGEIFLASQPRADDFATLRESLGVQSVVNMRHADEVKEFDEPKTVQELGMDYHNPAWLAPAELTDEKIEQNLELLRTARRPTIVHCGSSNRVGAIWMAYRVIDGGLSRSAALEEAHDVGLRTEEYQRVIESYLDRHGY